MAAKDDYLLDSLIEMGFVADEEFDSIRSSVDSAGEGVVDTLVARGFVSAEQIARAKANHFGIGFISLGGMRLPDEVIASVPRHIARRYNVVPVRRENDGLVIAVADPSDLDTLDGLQHTLNTSIIPAVASPEEIESAIAKYYGVKDDSVSKMIQDITEGEVKVGEVEPDPVRQILGELHRAFGESHEALDLVLTNLNDLEEKVKKLSTIVGANQPPPKK